VSSREELEPYVHADVAVGEVLVPCSCDVVAVGGALKPCRSTAVGAVGSLLTSPCFRRGLRTAVVMEIGRGGDSFEVKAESEPWGRARRRPSSEVEVESEPWGRARRRPSSEVEAGAKPWGRARQSFLWRLRLDLAAVSLTLAGGTAVGAGQAVLFSCQVSQWRGEVTAVASALSTEERASG
jgi:hypothetical protein